MSPNHFFIEITIITIVIIILYIPKVHELTEGFLIFGNEFYFGLFDFWGGLVFLDKVAAVDLAVIHNVTAIFFD